MTTTNRFIAAVDWLIGYVQRLTACLESITQLPFPGPFAPDPALLDRIANRPHLWDFYLRYPDDLVAFVTIRNPGCKDNADGRGVVDVETVSGPDPGGWVTITTLQPGPSIRVHACHPVQIYTAAEADETAVRLFALDLRLFDVEQSVTGTPPNFREAPKPSESPRPPVDPDR
jgi:hypothetical protein